MNTQIRAPGSANDRAPIPPRGGLVRRFLDGWRRFEDAMDYQPYDYTLDRIRALELRIEDLEQRLRAVADGSSTPPTAATLMAISQDPR